MTICLPHDLIWIKPKEDFFLNLPEWAKVEWNPTLPLIVRRDYDNQGLIPAGIRGHQRGHRHPVFIDRDCITKILTPEAVLSYLDTVSFQEHPTVRALKKLRSFFWPFQWGVGGSCGYSLATGQMWMRPNSDLDLIVRAPKRLERSEFDQWSKACQELGCRADTQVQTPTGGFALNEWLEHERVLVKTNHCPILLNDPWSTV